MTRWWMRAVVGAVVVGTCGPAGIAGQESVESLRAVRVDEGPTLDGRLDDEVWDRAPVFSELLQRNPDEGAPVSERTEVRFLIDDQALYVGARMWDSSPGEIRSRLARRDTPTDADFFAVMLDSRHDHLTAVEFNVNPSGSRRDGARGADGQMDWSWDPVWSAETQVDDRGWSAELRIPLSQLRYQPGAGAEWGLQFVRSIARKGEFAWFELVPRTEQLTPQRYGHLELEGEIHPTGRLELAPYLLARAESRNVPAGNPFRSGDETSGSVGLDLRFGIAGDLTLNATINPDFGQVEVDPAVVNLSAFEVFFPERRPFFVEGAELFRFGQTGGDINQYPAPNLFYSRRIGRAPQRRLSGYAYVDAPETSTIAGAAKITGRVGERWTVGFMGAATTEESAEVQTLDGTRSSEIVEPFTNTLVGRVRGDFRGGQTTIGAMATAVNRDLGRGPLAELLPSGAYVGGIDFNHTWNRRSWFLNGFVAGSTVRGSEEAIARVQAGPSHFFQRPDAEYLDFDPTRRSLSGASIGLGVGKVGGEHWLGSLAGGIITPGWDVNDAGFFQTGDSYGVQGLLTYRDTEPGDLTRFYRIDLESQYYAYRNGDPRFKQYSLGSIVQWANWIQTSARLFVRPRVYNNQITRGGPLAIQPGHWLFAVNANSDPRRSWQANLNVQFLEQEIGGEFRNVGLGATLRPSTALSVTLQPNWQTQLAQAQYVGAFPDPTATATGGVRYVVAEMEQTVFSLNTRVNWTFAPGLSLELFAQPFLASGDFRTWKQLATPRTIDLIRFGIDQGTAVEEDGVVHIDPDGAGEARPFAFRSPDFSIRSLRGNAVLRWEYRPGSTLFFVWQQQRRGSGDPGSFEFGSDFAGIFDTRPENVFAIKATWWTGF